MKVIAFYLPQFHSIPENDKWWGKGFTEWTNTKKGIPNFKGHYQPHIPFENNYYNLLDKETQKSQIELAKKYGVDGFCYYHYWFKNGKKLLERPIENMLHDSSVDMPFCLCWANETWSRRWDGSENEILIEQDYGDINNWKAHYNYLSQFFHDKRYIKIKNNPILVIYKPNEIEQLEEKLNYWNELAKKDGFEKIVYMVQYPQFNQKIEQLFDYTIEFEPQYTSDKARRKKMNTLINDPILFFNIGIARILQAMGIRTYKKFSYKIVSRNSSNRRLEYKHLPGAFPNWDNTARKKLKSDIYHGSSPSLFYRYLCKQFKKRYDNGSSPEFIFINAWNEWAEGAHLEPDEKYGYSYLSALKKAKTENNKNV